MSRLRHVWRAAAGGRGRRAGDAGVTLIEMVVTMSIMSIMMSIFVAGVVQMYRSANRTEATSRTQSQVAIAFLRLDREIRYAGAVSAPRAYGSDWYVEFLTTNVADPICTRLRLSGSTGRLERMAWPQRGHPVTGWTTLVTGLTVPAASPVPASPDAAQVTAPFSLVPPGSQYSYQQLRVVLTANGPAGDEAAGTELNARFAALNSTAGAAGTTVCQEGLPAS